MFFSELPTPALLLDLEVLEDNLARMAERARRLGVALRPHVKTHKCLEVARRQRELGARGLTVATLAEAQAFADAGFDDLTWAFPFVLSRLDEVRRLAARVSLGVLVDSVEAVDVLERASLAVRAWLKVDCGYHRAGVDPASELAVEIPERLSRSRTLSFAGLLTHAGHAYECRTPEALVRVAEEERRAVADLADALRAEGIEVPGVSVGSTPTMSVVDDLCGITEMRPGNYCFYDYTQSVIGSCELRDCATTVLATVVSSPPGSGRAVLDAGALALSKDAGPDPSTMGRLFDDYEARTLRPERLVALSQEHGKVNGELPVGDRARILVNHSCLTTACFDVYHVVRGDRVVGTWPIHRAR
jgi:D-serine deaminase-like pyridoxal phosphate-dependent protein